MSFWTERLKHAVAYIPIYFIILLTLFGSYKIYRVFFPKKVAQAQPTVGTNTGTIITNYNEKKRALIPFIEAYGGVNTNKDNRAEAGARVGLRLEF